MQIVQVDQKFVYHKPIEVGDELYASLEIPPSWSGSAPTSSSPAMSDQRRDGEMVLEAFTTLMGHEGDNSVSGQVGRRKRPGQPAP